jgi:hypothetical protein
MAVGSFSQKISIEGADEIRRALALLGTAGEAAFNQIQKAVVGANASLATMPAVLASVGAAFTGVGTAAARVGGSVAALGGPIKNLVSGLSLIAGIGLPLTFAATAAAMVKFVTASAEAGDEVNKLSQSLGLTVEQYQRLSFAASQAGIDQQQFGRAMTQLSKQVQDALKDQDKAFADFATAVGKETSVAIRSLTMTATTAGITFQELQTGAQALAARLKAAGIDVSLNDVIKKLSDMSRGSAEARQQLELLLGSVQLGGTALQKLQANSAGATNALLKLRIPLRNADGTARDLEQILGDLTDAFQKMPDGIEKNNRAIELFTAKGAQKMIPFLNQGRTALQQLTDEFSKLTTGFTKEGAQAAEAMNDAFSFLGTSLKDLRNQIAAPLFEPLTRVARVLQAALVDNRKEIEAFGAAVRARVTPIIEDFINLIAGRRELIQSSFIAQLPERIIAFGNAVRGAITGVVIPAFNTLVGLLQSVADAFNRVFGTDLTGGQLGIGLLILQFTGLASAVTNVIIAVGALALAFTRLAAHPVFITLTVFAAGIANVIGMFQDLTRAADPFQKRLEEINKEFAKTGDREKYLEQMRQLTQAETAVGTAAGTSATKVASLTQQLAAATPGTAQYDAILKQLTASTATLGTTSATTGVQVRTVANEAALAVRTATQNTGIVVKEVAASVQQLAQAGQQASATAEGGVDKLADEVAEVTSAAVPAENALLALGQVLFTGTLNQFNLMIRAIDELVRKAAEGKSALEGMSSGGGFGGGGGGGFQTGGYTGNAGTRQIAGFVHGGEYVQPARIVRQPGVLAFMETLRRVGDLDEAIRLFSRGFSIGGLVDNFSSRLASLTIPQFATGGFVPQLAPAENSRVPDFGTVTLDFGRGQRVRGIADRQIVEALRRIAIQNQTLSAGRES